MMETLKIYLMVKGQVLTTEWFIILAHTQRHQRNFNFLVWEAETESLFNRDFKVNEMKEDELRKSIRREKLQKQGLSVSQIITATATAGTGTSDDEDDASTPSGDNAERSLASTLGGSSESIPHPSTFLQVALDGPDLGRDKERGLLENTWRLKVCHLFHSFHRPKKSQRDAQHRQQDGKHFKVLHQQQERRTSQSNQWGQTEIRKRKLENLCYSGNKLVDLNV